MKQILALMTILALTGMTSEDLGKMVRPNDRVFVQRAYEGGYSEIFLAREIMHITQNRTARRFAARMIHDHSQNDAVLAKIAKSMHIRVEKKPEPDAIQEARELKTLPKNQIEEQYLTYEVNDHEKDITGFQNEADEGSVSRLRQYAHATLPVLKQHLALAQDLLHSH